MIDLSSEKQRVLLAEKELNDMLIGIRMNIEMLLSQQSRVQKKLLEFQMLRAQMDVTEASFNGCSEG